jgi:hypothetical protein
MQSEAENRCLPAPVEIDEGLFIAALYARK